MCLLKQKHCHSLDAAHLQWRRPTQAATGVRYSQKRAACGAASVPKPPPASEVEASRSSRGAVPPAAPYTSQLPDTSVRCATAATQLHFHLQPSKEVVVPSSAEPRTHSPSIQATPSSGRSVVTAGLHGCLPEASSEAVFEIMTRRQVGESVVARHLEPGRGWG